MQDKVLEFINRRFPIDNSDWKNGNCYYFSLILKDRFNGSLYYDVIWGHFVCKIDDVFYDYEGVYEPDEENHLICWDTFDEYDILVRDRIIRDVIM